VAVAVTLVFGIIPQPLLDLAGNAAFTFGGSAASMFAFPG